MNKEKYWLHKEFLSDIVNDMPAAIFWKDSDGIFVGCNSFFAMIAGLKKTSDIIGKTDFDLPWGQKQAELYRQDDLDIMRTRQPKSNIEETIMLADNRELYLLTNKVPLIADNNQIMGVLGIFHDITERKKTELTLEKARKKAELANKAKAEFIANMSHDIRTPLTGIIGLANLIEHESCEDNIKHYAHMLNMSGAQLLSLLNSVLDVVASNRLDQQILKIDTFSLEDLLQRISALELPSLQLKSIHFKLDIDKKLPKYVQSDKEKIYRIFLNILGNAIKFTHNGCITVKVRKICEQNDDILIKTQIIDTGIGIQKEDLNKIFEQFYRSNPAYEGKFDGYGVGLHIVQNYLKLLNGEIQVDSEVGRGTCISLILPFKKSSVVKNDILSKVSDKYEKEVPSQITTTAYMGNKSAKVLLVEDNLMAQTIAKNLLTKASCEVFLAANSQEAFKLFTQNSFDFVLTDIGLPDYSGFELTEKMTQFEREKRPNAKPTPVIGLTAHAKQEAVVKGTQSGMIEVCEKPLTEKTVMTFIKRFGKALEPDNHLNQPNAACDENADTLLDVELGISQLGSKDEFKKMLKLMLKESMTSIVNEIDSYFSIKDWAALGRVVHTFKSSCLYCATTKLLQQTRALEISIKTEKDAQIKHAYEQFKVGLAQTKQAIENWLSLKEM
ncbi:MAG TPA: hypothetical protein DIV44_13295 [Leeuwenhoekiella sp.]|nr:hypothetical protein [Legionellales bacterium]HCA90149.1 hypothetical protein [Legionellales bacterium]HCQ77778.1 hypothetical protein [Leeuwenhoekiella sp.]|tara:strand:+ start:1813 stop:3822 length:2010 start_codon:yes stop_codon:yes gene_type:complete